MRIDFLIITILDEELDAIKTVLPSLELKKNVNKEAFNVYYEGKIRSFSGSKHTVLVSKVLHMGNINAAANTQYMINKFKPENVIVFGIAGGIPENKINFTDVLISDQIVYYELAKLSKYSTEFRYQCYPASTKLLEYANLIKTQNVLNINKIHIGIIASGEKVIASDKFRKKLLIDYPKLIGVEMESAGVANVAHLYPETNFITIRGVSDLADENKNDDHRLEALLNAAKVLNEFLFSIPKLNQTSKEIQNSINKLHSFKRKLGDNLYYFISGMSIFSGIDSNRFVEEVQKLKPNFEISNLKEYGIFVTESSSIEIKNKKIWNISFSMNYENCISFIIEYFSLSNAPSEIASYLRFMSQNKLLYKTKKSLLYYSQLLLQSGYYEILNEVLPNIKLVLKDSLLKLVEARLNEHSGNYGRAKEIYNRLKKSKNSFIKSSSLYGLANQALANNNLTECEILLYNLDHIKCDSNLGYINHLKGYYYLQKLFIKNDDILLDISEKHFKDSLEFFKGILDYERQADTLYHLADLHLNFGLPESYKSYSEQCFRLLEIFKFPRIRANLYILKILEFAKNNQYKESMDIAKEAEIIFTQLGDIHKTLISRAIKYIITLKIDDNNRDKLTSVNSILLKLKNTSNSTYYTRLLRYINIIEKSK